MTKIHRLTGLVVIATAAAALSACAGSYAGSSAPLNTTATTSAPPAAISSVPDPSGVTTADEVFGPGCGQLPKGDAPGGLAAMGPVPVATAARTNPLLTKLAAAVGAVDGLGNTLNGAPSLTVFAPSDAAFAKLGAGAFAELTGDPAKLVPILQEHIVANRYDEDGLLAVKSLKPMSPNGKELVIAGSGSTMTVNGAKVLCGNIPTANATVFVIDTVLTP